MEMFTEIYSLRLNFVRDTNFEQDTDAIQDDLSSNFVGSRLRS